MQKPNGQKLQKAMTLFHVSRPFSIHATKLPSSIHRHEASVSAQPSFAVQGLLSLGNLPSVWKSKSMMSALSIFIIEKEIPPLRPVFCKEK